MKSQITAMAMEQINKSISLVLLLVYSCLTTAANNITTDESGLLAFKSRITSDPNNLLGTSWTNVNSVCNWTGVTCGTRHQRIIALNISNMDLDGSIPPEFGNLSFLDSLDLGGNNFRGNLPPEMASFCRLKYMDLSFNNFTGDIPSWFGFFSELQFLNVRNNSFSGFLPDSMFNISKLQKLILSSNFLQGRIPGEMANFHELNYLDMEDNQLPGSIPSRIFNISTLETLVLSRNRLSGSLPVDLCHHLPKMKILFLSFNELYGQVPSSLSRCSGLKILSLSYNNFEGPIPKEIWNLTMLEVLFLGANNFKGLIPEEIGNLHIMEYLYPEKNQIIGTIPTSIFNISSLKTMSFFDNILSGTLPESICDRLTRLEEIHLHGNRLYGQLPKKFHECSALRVFSLSKNKFTGSIPKEIGNLTVLAKLSRQQPVNRCNPQEVSNLQMLEVFGLGFNMLTGLLPVQIFNISTLQDITLNDNNFSGNLPSNIGEGLTNLEKLYLSSNNLDGVIPATISNCSKLAYLTLNWNKFSGPIPNSLGDLRLLRILDLAQNNLTSDSSFPELSIITSLTNCNYLIELGLNDNPLTGALPMSIANLSASIERLYAYNCEIKGTIPDGIGNLSNLSVLSLYGNYLTGSVPATFKGLQKLRGLSLKNNLLGGSFSESLCYLKSLFSLVLRQNDISGSIPVCLGNVTTLRRLLIDRNKFDSSIPASSWNFKNLLELDLSYNSLIGSLPHEVQNLKAVVRIYLSVNNLSGNIPSSIGGLQMLSSLSLAQNGLQGSIPEAMGYILSLEFLDLSQNDLSGPIPVSLEALPYLKYINLSFNNLRGEIPSGGPFKNFTSESFLFNDGLCGDPRFLVSPCSTSPVHRSSRKKVLQGIFIAVGILAAMLVMIITFLFLRNQRRRKELSDTMALLHGRVPERIPYYELLKATGGYDESNLLGRGSYGSVYRGTLKDGTLLLGVKVFNLAPETAFHSFEAECQVLRNLHHRNLIKVIGSCSNFDFKALVLEYMPNGSLEKWLYSYNYFLDIVQRLDIMTDVAHALEYLHHGHSVPVIHCDLKPSNVLLDIDMVAHVTDFSIAKLLAEEETTAHTDTLASFGYMAPEYGLEGLVSTKCDVYSFGIMLMETFTRRRPSDAMFAENLSLKSWIHESMTNEMGEVVDDNLLKPREEHLGRKLECFSSVMELAFCCTAESTRERISMRDALAALEKIKLQFLAHGG